MDDKTSKDIEDAVHKSLDLLTCFKLAQTTRKEIIKTLVGYRYVDQLDELHIGKFTRWIQKYPLDPDEKYRAKVERGGFLANIDFNDNGITLTIKMWNKKIFKLAFDNCLVYQKLSVGEELILMSSDYLEQP